MRTFSVVTSKSARLAAGAVLAAVLAACGGGSNPPAPVALADTVVAIDKVSGPVVAATVIGTTFTFPGVPEFGTTGPTKVTMGGTGAATTFEIEADGIKRSGNLIFGSCTFTVNTPASLAGSIFIKTCAIKVTTTGIATGGPTQSLSTSFTLNGISSAPQPVSGYSLGSDGTLSSAGGTLGPVPVGTPTGTGGGN